MTPAQDSGTPAQDSGTPDPDSSGPAQDGGTPAAEGGTDAAALDLVVEGSVADVAVVDVATADVPQVDFPPPPSDAALADLVVVDSAPPPPGCGDSTRDPGEECDDGNTTNLDGCSSACLFEQVHRITSLGLEIGTDAFCGNNAFGSAIDPIAASQVQAFIDNAIADGSMTVLLQFLGLDSLDGADDPLLVVGMMNGTPVVAAGYDGTNDLDWWYYPTSAHLTAARVPLMQLNGTISQKTLVAGPASISFPLYFGPTATILKLSHARISADIGATSTPLASAGQPPGHEASENLDPSIVSFESAGSSAGKLCGRIPASSLQAMPVLEELTGTGAFPCDEGYAASNSMLDVVVNGCTLFTFMPVIKPTQPDGEDPDVVPAGAGPPYTLIANAQTRTVDTCHDSGGQPAPLAACLADAAYSVLFSLSSRRVVAK